METRDMLKALNTMGISQEALGDFFGGRKKSAVSQWMSGEKYPDLTALEFYAGVLQCKEYLKHSKGKKSRTEKEFVYAFIDLLQPLQPAEKDNLRGQFEAHLKASQSNLSAGCDVFLHDLIHDIYTEQEMIRKLLVYDPANPLRPVVAIAPTFCIAVQDNGCVKGYGDNRNLQLDVTKWRNVVSVAAGNQFTLGLKKNKTCIATGKGIIGNGEIFEWKNIISISAGWEHAAALQENGHVLAQGENRFGQCDVSHWRDIIAICCGSQHTVGLKKDGTVVAAGKNSNGQCEVELWQDVVFITAGIDCTAAITRDGRVLLAGSRECHHKVQDWQDVIMLAMGSTVMIGLKKDGAVLVTDSVSQGAKQMGRWKNVIAICGGGVESFIGVKKDGTLYDYRCGVDMRSHFEYGNDMSNWRLFEGGKIEDEEDIDRFYRRLSKLHAIIAAALSYANTFKKYLIGQDYANQQDKIGFLDVINVDMALDLLFISMEKVVKTKPLFQREEKLIEFLNASLAATQAFYDSLEKKPLNNNTTYQCTPASEGAFVQLYQALEACDLFMNDL